MKNYSKDHLEIQISFVFMIFRIIEIKLGKLFL